MNNWSNRIVVAVAVGACAVVGLTQPPTRSLAAKEPTKPDPAAVAGGKTYIEEVGEKDGKPVFRAGTVVPAVMSQCAVCHGGREGRVLGAIVYELPIK